MTTPLADEELAKRYRETYGRDSYTPEQVDRMVASAPVVKRQRLVVVGDSVTGPGGYLAVEGRTLTDEEVLSVWEPRT